MKGKINLRSLNAMETKNRLLQTSLKLFKKRGFDKVTVEDITRYSGVSKGTFYNYFSTKEQVLVEQFDSIDLYYKQTLCLLAPDTPVAERAMCFIDAMSDFCRDIWGLSFLKIVYINQISLDRHPSMLLKKDRLFYKIIEDIVRQGRDEGVFTTDMPVEEQVYLFASSARSLLYEWCLHDGEFDLKAAGRSFFARVMKLISKPQA
ncbi:TetR/AcrR family transcriptional regulator [Oleispirillum naphthae]|uniref:TetR/AcrR family transcriptional regulator n=1 Tax=Oleispirillum naphthae TaxID=2838853 RepID=UPI003082272C